MLEEGHPLRIRIVVPEKVTHYLLIQNSDKSRSRCKFFTSFGFDPKHPDLLLDAIFRHPETGVTTQIPTDEYGERWNVVGPILTPDGRNPIIRTGWIKDTSDPPRFVSAIPKTN